MNIIGKPVFDTDALEKKVKQDYHDYILNTDINTLADDAYNNRWPFSPVKNEQQKDDDWQMPYLCPFGSIQIISSVRQRPDPITDPIGFMKEFDHLVRTPEQVKFTHIKSITDEYPNIFPKGSVHKLIDGKYVEVENSLGVVEQFNISVFLDNKRYNHFKFFKFSTVENPNE